MKKLAQRPQLLIPILIAAYLAFIIIGMAALCIYPLLNQRNAQYQYSKQIGQEYLEGSSESLERQSTSFTHIFIYDASGNCKVYNNHINDHTEADFHDFLAPFVQKTLQGGNTFHISKSIFSNILTRIWVVTGVPIMENGICTGAVMVAASVSYLQEALVSDLIFVTICYWLVIFFVIRTTRQRLRLDKMRQDYIDNVTHELKAPIASTKILIETLSDNADEDSDPDKRRMYYGMALSAINKQSHMVNEILDLSRLQNKPGMFEKSDFSFGELFGQTLEKAKALCDCIGINLILPEETEKLPLLRTNTLITQVFENLITNATTYVQENDCIEISVVQNKNYLTISVKDTGPGISREDQEHIFERFYRCKSTNTSGSGLGLAISKEIASGLGEKLWLESSPGKGSTFSFTVHTK